MSQRVVKRPDTSSPQRFHQRTTAQTLAQISRQGADVSALAAANLDVQPRIMVGEKVKGANVHCARPQRKIPPRSSEIVGASTGHLGGRVSLRNLLNFPYVGLQSMKQRMRPRRVYPHG